MAVLGVDACRGGWAGIVLRQTGEVIGVHSKNLAELVERASEVETLRVIGVDMPIGLPDEGPRVADLQARKLLGSRWQSVFLAPVRSALAELEYEDAAARYREVTQTGLSRQAFGLFRGIREVEAWVRQCPTPVVEVHPEVSFLEMSDGTLSFGKKSWAGAIARRSLLLTQGVEVPDELGALGSRAGVDDVLDAAAAAWTARRHMRGEARSLPDPPETFSDGWPAAIWV